MQKASLLICIIFLGGCTGSCIDSDGNSYFLKGTITGVQASGKYFKSIDTCTNEITLKKFSCKGNKENEEYHTCDIGCLDGACLQDVCSLKGITCNGKIMFKDGRVDIQLKNSFGEPIQIVRIEQEFCSKDSYMIDGRQASNLSETLEKEQVFNLSMNNCERPTKSMLAIVGYGLISKEPQTASGIVGIIQ